MSFRGQAVDGMHSDVGNRNEALNERWDASGDVLASLVGDLDFAFVGVDFFDGGTQSRQRGQHVHDGIEGMHGDGQRVDGRADGGGVTC